MTIFHTVSRGLTTRLVNFVVGVIMAAFLLGTSSPALSQVKDSNASDRKLLARVEPEYPETLKRLYIGGVVRVEIVVGPNGNVQSTQLLGGSPILGQSAMKAVRQWKYAPGVSKDKFVVQLEFDPHR
jgi:TonB family protein